MSSRIEYYGKSGQHLKYSMCKPDGTPKGAPLHLLPESQTPGYYTTISHTNLEKDDKVVIYGPENVLYEGEPLTYEGDFVIVDETVGKGEFSAEAQDLASTKQNGEKAKSQPEGEWSKPMSKSKMMQALHLGPRQFKAFSNLHGLRQAGNRQLWQIRLDTIDKNTRDKLERA